jgi:hypothetical protein
MRSSSIFSLLLTTLTALSVVSAGSGNMHNNRLNRRGHDAAVAERQLTNHKVKVLRKKDGSKKNKKRGGRTCRVKGTGSASAAAGWVGRVTGQTSFGMITDICMNRMPRLLLQPLGQPLSLWLPARPLGLAVPLHLLLTPLLRKLGTSGLPPPPLLLLPVLKSGGPVLPPKRLLAPLLLLPSPVRPTLPLPVSSLPVERKCLGGVAGVIRHI